MSARDKDALAARGMTSEEAERVLERAARLQAEREGQGRLSRADVEEGAREVGIDPSLIDAAARQLYEEDARAKAREGSRRRALLLSLAIVAAALVLGSLYAHFSLDARLSEVEKRQAQLQNVLDRRRALVPQLLALAQAEALDASERASALKALGEEAARTSDLKARLATDDAIAAGLLELHRELARSAAAPQQTLLVRVADEMAGAQNRISVERKRYDEAAADYNRAARGIPLRFLRPLVGMPAAVPLFRGEP